jgi:hypothetical protein
MGVSRVSGERRTVRSGCKLDRGNLTCVLLGRRRGSFGPSRDTIFNECGVFALGRHRLSQVAGAPRRLPLHPTRPSRVRVLPPSATMCLTHNTSRSDLRCCHDRLPLYVSGNMLHVSFHTMPCWV